MTTNFEAPTVLVVEDDFNIRETLRDALEIDGYQVVTADNGREALDKIHAGPKPDLILLDMMMPVMSGREFLDAAGADAKIAPIPVVVISATADATSARGAAAFIKKPPDLELILQMVAKYTNRS